MTDRFVRAIRHVGFEDLGSFAPALEKAGYRIEYVDVATRDLGAIDPLDADILIVLGGPVGVYDGATYPFIAQEAELLRGRLDADRPTLGICLGAQLIAAALGARVYPGPRKEIGWGSLDLTERGRDGPLRALESVRVLHWHGDTFDLPEHCDLLASTAIYPRQAFARGTNTLGVQFHAEATAADFEHWLIGHACELASTDTDPHFLREDSRRHASRLEEAAQTMLSQWLDMLGT